ncbi:MAG: TonB-dependent receptor [candidate division KSB1 bacterium]|nr:TonB-dependent receptor [candidate division KSB1 bacterium]MDZ7364824.1 TonB-dependent receptor [candidate division KSB1 bacterium]MDZ7402927.1 TonB-dependent receptor [candidate division KSB1 bacterium]
MKQFSGKILATIFILLAALFAAPVFSSADENSGKTARLYGAVFDKESKQPLPGANVFVLELKRGAATDENGAFSIDGLAAGRYTLVCRLLGYEEMRKTVIISTMNLKQDFYLKSNPIELQGISISAEKNKINLTESSQARQVLSEAELQKHRGQTLGETLKDIPGVTVLQTGPAIAKPVIRGLHSQRVLVLNAGVPQEGQQWGGEHAPEIDPFSPARIEVLKGAAGVQYGAGAIGGVIRLEPRDLRKSGGIGGELTLNAFSNNLQGAASLLLEGGLAKWPGFGWRAQGSLRRAGDAKTPAYHVLNSGFDERDWAAAIGYNAGRRSLEMHFSHFGTTLGIFRGSHLGNVTDLLRAIARGRPSTISSFSYDINAPKQNIRHNLLSLKSRFELANLGRLEMLYGWQQNHRQEFDAHAPFSSKPPSFPSFDLTLTTHTADVTFQHQPVGNFFGKVGVSGMRQGNVLAASRSLLIPNFRAYSGGVFMIESWVSGAWTVDLGGRYDYRWFKTFRRIDDNVVERIHDYSNVTGVVGLIYQFAPSWSIGANLGSAWRPPSLNELYSNGVHHGTAQFEIGDLNLQSERSTSLDLTLRHLSARGRAEISVYHNHMHNFIFLFPDPEPTLTVRGAFPTFRYQQAGARLRGFDGAVEYQLSELLQLGAAVAVVRGDNLETHEPLFQMPADRLRLTMHWHLPDWGRFASSFFELNATLVKRQTRFPQNVDYADPPPGYSLLDINLGTEFQFGGQPLRFNLSAQNIANQTYRDYLSRFRYFTDDPGRNVVLRLQMPFGTSE